MATDEILSLRSTFSSLLSCIGQLPLRTSSRLFLHYSIIFTSALYYFPLFRCFLLVRYLSYLITLIMIHHEYIDPLVNEITYFSQLAITILAYFFNLILIFIVHTNKKRDIGTYRILITFFALSDIYYNTVHYVVYPIPEMYGNAFMMRGHGFYRELIGVAAYTGVYGHAFPILIFHFLYRVLAIKYPHLLKHFILFLLALFLATLSINALWFSIFYWFFHPDDEFLLLLSPIFNGSIPLLVVHSINTAEKHSQALYWRGETFEGPRWRNLIGAALMCLSMIFTYIVIIYCSYLINKYLKKRTKSALSIRVHKQLFRSLIYQSFVPLFTAYYPAGTSVLFPIFGITIPYVSILVPPACATHPLFDPILLIFTITEYRRSFFALIGLSPLTRLCFSSPSKESTTCNSTISPSRIVDGREGTVQ